MSKNNKNVNNKINIDKTTDGGTTMKEESKRKIKRENKRKNLLRGFLKFLAVLIMIVLLLILGIGAGVYIYIKGTLGTMQQVDINKADIEINEGVQESLEGYRTIALFGVDSRESQVDSGTRSDCIILAVIDQKTKAVKLVSVYRDTYLKISGKSLDKITHAYAYGGPALSLSTLNANLDLNITEFVTVNFEVLIDIVDEIGGVTINVTKEEVTYLNKYVRDMSKEIGTPKDTISGPGEKNLNGVQALAYSRIRYTAGGDFKRTERMRDVLKAIVEKAKKMNVVQLNALAKKILPEVYTNVSPDEIIGMVPQVATYSIEESIGWPYENKGPKINGVYYGVPTTLESNVVKLHQEIYDQEDYEASETVKTISESIIKKAGK